MTVVDDNGVAPAGPMLRSPRTLAVVLNWNGADNTLRCLQHLMAQSCDAVEVLVIDNGSTDDSVSRIRQQFGDRCEIVALRANVGFAEGMNVGIRAAMSRGSDYIWMLNNDAFAEADCLAQLLRFMEANPSVVIAGPRLLRPDGTEQPPGGRIDWASGENQPLLAEALSRPATSGIWLAGTAWVVRVDGLEPIGLFDRRFFAYYEDVDLCARVLSAGGDIRVVPQATVCHYGKSSTGGATSALYQFLMVRNAWLCSSKHAPRRMRVGAFMRYLASGLMQAGLLHDEGYGKPAGAVIWAMICVLRGRYGEPRRTTCPAIIVRLVATHPWKVMRVLRQTADWVDRSLGCHRDSLGAPLR